MGRRAAPDLESAGSDSFLDVITNVVGILIILVMIVGAQARNAPVEVPVEPRTEPHLREARALADRLEGDVRQLANEIITVQSEVVARFQQRQQVATLLAAAEKELELHRESLSGKARETYDLQRALAAARVDWERLENQRAKIAEAPAPVIQVESFPTPLSKTVDGKEAHFQLREGRLAYIPLDDLLARFKSDAQRNVIKLRDDVEFTGMVGPVGGFSLRYILRRSDIPWEEAIYARQRSIVELSKWELIPTSNALGETIEAALSNTSELRAKLDAMNARQWTITVWVYPDSFEEFRRLRKELYHLGYPVAGRPLPFGIPIGGSPRGSKSAAE